MLPPQAMHSSSTSRLAAWARAVRSRIALIQQQDGMDVAVAGMGHVDDADAMLGRNLRDAAENVRQAGPRHDAVLKHVARAEAAQRADGHLAAFPQQLPLGRRLGLEDLARLPIAANGR